MELVLIYTAVFELYERFTCLYRDRVFAYFIDNLFTNLLLVIALRFISIDIYGTIRANANGYPAVLAALKLRFPNLLALN